MDLKKCANCGENHGAKYPKCPYFWQAQQVQNIQFHERVPRHVAKGVWEQRERERRGQVMMALADEDDIDMQNFDLDIEQLNQFPTLGAQNRSYNNNNNVGGGTASRQQSSSHPMGGHTILNRNRDQAWGENVQVDQGNVGNRAEVSATARKIYMDADTQTVLTVGDPDMELVPKNMCLTPKDLASNLTSVLLDFMTINTSQVNNESKKNRLIESVENAFGVGVAGPVADKGGCENGISMDNIEIMENTDISEVQISQVNHTEQMEVHGSPATISFDNNVVQNEQVLMSQGISKGVISTKENMVQNQEGEYTHFAKQVTSCQDKQENVQIGAYKDVISTKVNVEKVKQVPVRSMVNNSRDGISTQTIQQVPARKVLHAKVQNRPSMISQSKVNMVNSPTHVQRSQHTCNTCISTQNAHLSQQGVVDGYNSGSNLTFMYSEGGNDEPQYIEFDSSSQDSSAHNEPLVQTSMQKLGQWLMKQ